MSIPRISLLAALTLLAALLAAPGASAGQKPDLVVANVSKPPATLIPGKRAKLVVKVRNKGKGGAPKNRVGVYLLDKRAPKGKKGKGKFVRRRLKRAKVKALKPGKKGKAKLRVLVPANATLGSRKLVVCADDTHKVRESKESNNCRNSKSFKLVAAAAAAAPVPAARPAFTLTDDIESAFGENAQREDIKAGSPVNAEMRAGNGLPGQAGYTRADVAPEPLLSGATTNFTFGSEEDDGDAAATLPFDFPFGGISERTARVSTNGWIGLGGPALDYWEDGQPDYYAGFEQFVGEFYRGIMPYWGDLDAGVPSAGDGTVAMVIAADGGSVAFQWDINQHEGPGHRRVIQLVLFPDGSFRFDYPGANEAGGNEAFVGFSLGTGAASVNTVAANVTAVPPSSILFTPNPVPTSGPLAAGQATLTLPDGSAFISGDPSCALTTPPGPMSEGLVTCAVPELAPGQQAARAVTYAMPPNAAGQSDPANFRYLATLLAPGFQLADGDQINALGPDMAATTVAVEEEYISAAPQVGLPAQFKTTVSSTASLDEPKVTFALPANTSLTSVTIGGEAIPCTPVSAGQTTCKLPSGAAYFEVVVTVTPEAAAAGAGLTLTATASALNAPAESASTTSPNVTP